MDRQQLGAFILRLALGITFMLHGFDKFQGGIGNTVGWFESIGLPGMLAYVVATIELLGGFALIVGLGVKIVSALFGIIMIGATLMVKLSAGFLGGWELDLAFLAMSVYLVLNGSPAYSLDRVLVGSKKEIAV